MLKVLTATALVAGALAGAAAGPAQASGGDVAALSTDSRVCIYLSWPPRLCSLRS